MLEMISNRLHLHLACHNGHFQCVEQLLKNDKVDPDARTDRQVDSIAFGLSQVATWQCVEQLLKNDKVDPDAKD